ncbi:MAG TPA: hypothetical protein VJM33_04165 [Microthrixaceae bacterium]|nr:hypothetical protein [Microthrixaceae bacterium]
MSVQLILIDESDRDWRLDDHTREVGRRGIAAARDVLRAHPRHRLDDAGAERNAA